jgi:hypothetical protein
VIFNKKIYKSSAFKVVSAAGLICALLTLSNPYIANITRYHAVDYPYNEPVFASSLKITGVPINIRNDSKLELFYYGIFGSAISDAQDPTSLARLKVPFTFTSQDLLSEANVTSKLVGGYGIFFSGIFILSLAGYSYLTIIKKSKRENIAFRWLSAVLGIVILSCLVSPIPNYARYTSQLDFVPIAIAVTLLIIKRDKRRLASILAAVLIVCMSLNIYLDTIAASLLRQTDFSAVNSQLSNLKRSNKTYLVYASTFYPTYLKLESHGVKIKISDRPVNCKQLTVLYFSDATLLCPLQNQ